MTDKTEDLTGAIQQLRDHQRQLDMDGIQVGVSRQALEMVLSALSPAPEAGGELERAPSLSDDLRPYGYAPGSYVCRCVEEGCQSVDPLQKEMGTFQGDKRAWRCEPCATALRKGRA